jgi:hypothetical protein
MAPADADRHDPILIEEGTFLDGRYEVLERLGTGTMAFVVRARDRETGWMVACKVPLDLSPFRTDALLAQYRKLMSLGSPHLPAVHGLVRHRTSEPNFLFIVLELVQGTPIEDWHQGKPLRLRLEALSGLAETVAALTADGQAHGDLDVGNVLVRGDGRIALIDPDAERFGSSRTPAVAVSGERRQDVVGLRGIIEHCTTELERERLRAFLRPLANLSGPGPPDAAAIAAAIRHLLSGSLLPGETSASLAELAPTYQRRTENNLANCRRIMHVRDLVFRNSVDLLRGLAAPFAIQVPDGDQRTAPDSLLLQRELESLASARVTLHHRQVECLSRTGDKLILTFDGKDFRPPWPHPDRPGLSARASSMSSATTTLWSRNASSSTTCRKHPAFSWRNLTGSCPSTRMSSIAPCGSSSK